MRRTEVSPKEIIQSVSDTPSKARTLAALLPLALESPVVRGWTATLVQGVSAMVSHPGSGAWVRVAQGRHEMN